MLEGLIRAGYQITGTWPMRTEMEARALGRVGTNALASSIVLVCRPRPDDAPLTTRRDFLAALKRELPAALRDLQRGNVHEEIVRRLREDRARGDFAAVHIAPLATADVPDEPMTRLVVLHPKHPHVFRSADSAGRQQAAAILAGRGAGQRLYQNMLAFLAPEKARLAELVEAVRSYLAWKSIFDERDALDLGAFQRSQAETKLKLADETVSRPASAAAWS